MSSRRHAPLAALAVLAVVTVLAPPAAAQRGPLEQPGPLLWTETHRTLPKMPGLRIRFLGNAPQTVVTDSRGEVPVSFMTYSEIPLRWRPRFVRSTAGRWFPRPVVQPKRLPDGGRVELDSYAPGQIVLASYYRFDPDFRRPDGTAMADRLIQGYRLKSRTGEVIDVKGARSVVLKSSRIVKFGAKVVDKDIEWSLERVMVAGSNVVDRAKYRFRPRALHNRPYPVPLRLYPLRITSTDALFGFHVGKDVTLEYPNGRRVRLPFRDSEINLPAVPRGTYIVKANAVGVSPERPVAVSRPQVVELEVVSWLDLLLAGLFLGGFAILLLVARRPHLRQRWRRLPPPDPAPWPQLALRRVPDDDDDDAPSDPTTAKQRAATLESRRKTS